MPRKHVRKPKKICQREDSARAWSVEKLIESVEFHLKQKGIRRTYRIHWRGQGHERGEHWDEWAPQPHHTLE